MDLNLWRHADAEEAHGTPDLERHLSPHGERQGQEQTVLLCVQTPEVV